MDSEEKALISTFQSYDLFREIELASELEKALDILRKVDVIGAILEKSKQFEEHSIAYARLHAEAIVRVAELGGEDRLPRGFTKKAAIWLDRMKAWEREPFFEMLKEGLSIEQVYKREVADKEKQQRIGDKLHALQEKALDEVEHEGVVDLDGYKIEVGKVLNDFYMRNDAIEGTRIALRKMGAVGVEPRSDLYVMPTEENEYYIQRAIATRIKSVCNDILKIKSLAERCNVRLPYSDAYCLIQELWDNRLGYFDRGMKGTTWAAINGNQTYSVFLMMIFAEANVFSDVDAFYTDFVLSQYENLEEYFRNELSPKSQAFRRLMNYAKTHWNNEGNETDGENAR